MAYLGTKWKKLKKKHAICLYTACVAAAGMLMFDAAAQVQQAQAAAEAPFDINFWVRTLLGILLAFIAYWTRGLEKRVELLEHENKNINSAIGMMRENMLREYHTKRDIEKHWESVDAKLEHIQTRLDYMSRPQHRRSDDKEEERGWLERR